MWKVTSSLYSSIFLLILFLSVISAGSAYEVQEVTDKVEQVNGFNDPPYSDGDTLQGTLRVHWTDDEAYPPISSSGTTSHYVKLRFQMTYKDSSGEWRNDQIGEVVVSQAATIKPGDVNEYSVSSMNIDASATVSDYNNIVVKPMVKYASGGDTWYANEYFEGLPTTVESDGGGDGGSGNQRPVPSLDIPSQIEEGVSFTADASGSYDSDGSIENYEWDWTDDGVYETYGALETANHFYMYPGEKTISLRVEDDDGATASISEDIQVTQDCAEKTVGDIEVNSPYGGSDYTFDVKAAFWGLDTDGIYTNQRTDCTYNHASPRNYDEYSDFLGSAPIEAWSNNPMVFECVNGTTNSLASYPSPPNDELSTVEENYFADTENQAEEYCQQRANYDFETVGETMPMTQFYIPTDAIPYGPEGASYISTNGNYQGLITHKFSDLYRAMTRYDRDNSIWTCGECENETTWSSKNMSQTSAYSNPGPDKDGYQDAWVVDNMGGGNNPNIQESQSFTAGPDKFPSSQDSDVFPGGFGGNCQGIQTWQISDTGEWICSSDVGIVQEIFMPTLDYPDDQESDMVRAGFHIMPQLFNTSQASRFSDLPRSLTQATDRDLIENQTINKINAMCWWGDNERYRDLKQENAGQAWFTVSYQDMPTDIENPLPVHGELNRTLRSEYGNQYSCKWTLTADPAVKFSDLNVDPDSMAKEYDVYTTTGTIEDVTPAIQTYVDERGFESDSIDLNQSYRSPMLEDKFADVSFEWQGEAGYTRYDTSTESDQQLDCKPNQPPFDSNSDIRTCTVIDYIDWEDIIDNITW